jgi:hypothetical protein
MVCPLRYVVAAFSVALALFVFLWSEYDRRKQALIAPRSNHLSKSPATVNVGKVSLKELGETLASFFTGRYLLDHWRAYSEVKAQRTE